MNSFQIAAKHVTTTTRVRLIRATLPSQKQLRFINQTAKMPVTELVFPIYKQDASSQSELKAKAPEIFKQFSGVEGLKSLFRGSILAENGEFLPNNSGRTVLVLEWDQASSFHAFFPNSAKFQGFVKLVKPLAAAPAQPELFEANGSSASCSAAGVTQIIKVAQTEDADMLLDRVQKAVSEFTKATPVSFYARGIDSQQGTILLMFGWQSQQDYEKSKSDDAVLLLLRELSATGRVSDLVAQLTPIDV